MTDKKDTTHFGFERVAVSEKTDKVNAVFSSVADKYDLMNDLMSFGIHRLWKRCAIDKFGLCPGQTVLDLASGSGDLVKLLHRRVGNHGKVIASDINPKMLAQAKRNMIDAGIISNIDYVEANAEALPFPDNHVDAISMAFGLRNVTDKDQALREMFRVIKPGGHLLIVEFSKVSNTLLKKLYDAYSFNVIPKLGKLVANDENSYRYLVESIRVHPDQEQLKAMIKVAGFEQVRYENLTGGVVALHFASKPQELI
ncbi:MAG: bifunctional demethylmenaquinone methyltransferase/2-methoxy-6-polyprenyl-1,4-benzoquinol methylase UbiE [Pseudomonadota bacterium]